MLRTSFLAVILVLGFWSPRVLLAKPTRTDPLTAKASSMAKAPEMTPIEKSKEQNCGMERWASAAGENLSADRRDTPDSVDIYVLADDSESAPPSQPALVQQGGCVSVHHGVVLHVGSSHEIANRGSTSHGVHALTRPDQDRNKPQASGVTPKP